MPRISTDNYDTVASWNGSQDLFVVEQPDGTKVATPEQIKQYVLGNSIDDIYSVMGQNGAKNLIPYPYYHTSKTTAGITITDNGDGTLTFNGTSTSSAVIFRLINNDANIKIPLNKSKYILTWVDSSEHKRYFRIDIALAKTDGTTVVVNGESGVINIDNTNGEYKGIYSMGIFTTNNQTVSNLTFKPMLRLASDTDNTYQPYAKTNRQLTEQMAVPKYDAANRREYYEGGAAFDGNIDSVPTAGSNNAVASGGTKTYVDNAVSAKQDTLVVVTATLASSASGISISYPTGLNKTNAFVVGWNLVASNWKHSGFNIGGNNKRLQIALKDNEITVYNDDSAFYGKTIYILLAKIV